MNTASDTREFLGSRLDLTCSFHDAALDISGEVVKVIGTPSSFAVFEDGSLEVLIAHNASPGGKGCQRPWGVTMHRTQEPLSAICVTICRL
jgi:hypothetical protein